MGNDRTDGTLMFMMYSDSTGKNITLSPRRSGSHVEPSYTKDIGITFLPGSSISDGLMRANAMCTIVCPGEIVQ